MPEQTVFVDQNQLVIYFASAVPKSGPTVQLDEFTLISNAPAALSALEKAKTAVEIAHKIGDMAQKAEQAQPPPLQPMPSAVKVEIVARLALDFGNVGTVIKVTSPEPKWDWNPWKETKVDTIETTTKIITIETTTTDYPTDFFKPTEAKSITVEDKPAAPVKVETTPDAGTPATSEPDAGAPDTGTPAAGAPPDAGSNPKVIAPQDDAWVDDEVVDPFLNVMEAFGTMAFSTSAGAQSYLDYQLEKAGLDLKISSTGMTLAEAGPQDPAGVESQLRKQGIQDDNVIAVVRAETNDVIKRFEETIVMLQTDLSAATPQGPDSLAEDPGSVSPPLEFGAVVQQWDTEFASQFSTDLPEAATDAQPAMLDVTNGVVTMTTPFASGDASPKVSPTGLITRAGVGSVASDTPPAGGEAGFQPTPLVSVFDEEAWKKEA